MALTAPAIDTSQLERVRRAERVEDENLPRLGFGLMRLPLLPKPAGAAAADPEPIDVEQVTDMVDACMAAGMNYFDTAYTYLGGRSELVAGQALVARYPRDTFFLATKLPFWSLRAGETPDEILARQLERTGAGYFDLYLLHNVEGPAAYAYYEEQGCFAWAQRQRAAGRIRHFGFSFHGGPELLEQILYEHPEVEFVQLQLNYLDWENPVIQSRANYEVARAHGLPIVVMEPIKGGALAAPVPAAAELLRATAPEASPASWALRFIAGKPGIMTVLSGMSARAQMAENVATLGPGFQPLNAEEAAVLEQAAEAFRIAPVVACTACRYCLDGCPMGIPITDILRALNAYRLDGLPERAQGAYERAVAGAGRASDCIQCGQCEGACPQHLPIIELLQEAAEAFEE